MEGREQEPVHFLSPEEIRRTEAAVDKAVHRLQQLPPTADRYSNFEDRSGPRLMQDYLQRMARWSQALKTTGFWAFGDLAAALDLPRIAQPQGEAIDPCDYDASVPPRLKKAVEDAARSTREERVLRGYAHLAAIRELQYVRDNPRWEALADPYEPMLRLLERGSTFHTENGIVDVGVIGVGRGRPQDWLKRQLPELASFSDDDLDAFHQVQLQREAEWKKS